MKQLRLSEHCTLISQERDEAATPHDAKSFSATITRLFIYKDKIVGKLIHETVCQDAYLEKWFNGMMPVVVNPRSDHFSFLTYDDQGGEISWGGVSYNKARRLAERQTTFLGRLQNKAILTLKRRLPS